MAEKASALDENAQSNLDIVVADEKSARADSSLASGSAVAVVGTAAAADVVYGLRMHFSNEISLVATIAESPDRSGINAFLLFVLYGSVFMNKGDFAAG